MTLGDRNFRNALLLFACWKYAYRIYLEGECYTTLTRAHVIDIGKMWKGILSYTIHFVVHHIEQMLHIF